jgi:hypothetical protein
MRTSAFPPWQSVQPRRSVPVACMVGWSVCVWQETQPALLRSASSCICPIMFGPVLSSAARSAGAEIRVATVAMSKLTHSAAQGEACASRAKEPRIFILRFISLSVAAKRSTTFVIPRRAFRRGISPFLDRKLKRNSSAKSAPRNDKSVGSCAPSSRSDRSMSRSVRKPIVFQN